jgi:hypothetical protein
MATRRMWTSPAERRNGDFIRDNAEWINACTDLSDGGLALAAFEMAVAGDVGITLEAADTPTLYGEDQGRYLIATSYDKAEALMVAAGRAGVPMVTVGRVGGDTPCASARSEAPLAELAGGLGHRVLGAFRMSDHMAVNRDFWNGMAADWAAAGEYAWASDQVTLGQLERTECGTATSCLKT